MDNKIKRHICTTCGESYDCPNKIGRCPDPTHSGFHPNCPGKRNTIVVNLTHDDGVTRPVEFEIKEYSSMAEVVADSKAERCELCGKECGMLNPCYDCRYDSNGKPTQWMRDNHPELCSNGKYGLKFGDIGVEEANLKPVHDIPVFGEIMKSGPIHKDDGKEVLSLIPYPAMKLAADILTYGLKKYAEFNYKNPPGLTTKQLINSAMRHIGKYNNGEDLDDESGLPHLGHAMVNLMMIVDLQANGMGGEYRWKIKKN